MDTRQEQIIRRAASEIRTWHAVTLIGAGASFLAGYPLVNQLPSLLWQSVSADAEVLNTLRERFVQPGATAKQLIGEDPTRTQIALEVVVASSTARLAYQQGFANLNAQRILQPSTIHDVLAQLLHRRQIETVISFNWDTLLEAAYNRRYGSDLKAGGPLIYKPHGDAADPESRWIFPHEGGRIPDDILAHVQSLAANHPRVLLIVGYSERDEEVVRRLVRPVEENWRVVRIGPGATGDWGIALGAVVALPALLTAMQLPVETPGWRYVSFGNQHDLGQALTGQSLGPADVTACPRLREVEACKQLIDTTNSVVLVGGSGCGKSITAYHVAYDLHCAGWEVLALSDPHKDPNELISATENLPQQTVFIVDDAQTVAHSMLTALLDKASDKSKVIIIATDDLTVRSGTVRLAGERAVSDLAERLSIRNAEILPIIQRLDKYVGDGYGQTALEDRLASAAKSKYPWQFAFILTGGWNRTRDEIATLKEEDRADLLLAAVAIGQIITLDAGASTEWLEKATEVIRRDKRWMDSKLQILRNRRLILGTGPFHCPHLRAAAVILEIVYERRDDPAWNSLLMMPRQAIVDTYPPLHGIVWLLSNLSMAQAFLFHGQHTIVDDHTWHRLLERCWAATSGEDRNSAAFLLNEARHWRSDQIPIIRAHSSSLGQWLEEIDGAYSWGMARLLNDLSHDHRDVAEEISAPVDPAKLAASCSQLTWANAAGWGNLLGRLAVSAPRAWYEKFATALNEGAFRTLLSTLTPADLYAYAELTKGIASVNYPFSLELVEQTIPTIAQALNQNPVDTFREVRDVLWFIVGYAPHFLRRRGPGKQQRAIARKLVQALNSTAIASALSSSRRRDWEEYGHLLFFLGEAAPRFAQRVANQIDFDRLSMTAQGLWSNLPHELDVLIRALSMDENNEPARYWVTQHIDEVQSLYPLLALVAPEPVIARLQEGCTLPLGIKSPGNWDLSALALTQIAQHDHEIAVKVADENVGEIAQGLTNLNEGQCEDAAMLVQVLKELSLDVLHKAVVQIDPSTAQQHWSTCVSGKVKNRKAFLKLLSVLEGISSPIADLVTDLRTQTMKAPSRRRPGS